MSAASPVSVVATCYNLQRYIGEAIESVLGQRDAPPFELIVVDDCSTDRSAEIIRGYRQARYVRTPTNGGVLLAMLAGVAEAKNDIVCLLDGDDVWDPGKLAATGAAFDAGPVVALITHDLGFIDQRGRPIDRRSRPAEELTPLEAKAADRIRQGILELHDYVWLGSALSFRRSLARWGEFAKFAEGLPDPRNCYQDWPLAFWIAALGQVRLGYVPQKLFRYRLHELNYSGDAATPAKAIRNLVRTRNTTDAMQRIAVLRGLPESIRCPLDCRVRFCDYLIDLYSGRGRAAARGWLLSLGYLLKRRLLLKETARFLGIQLLGPTRFSRLSSRRRLFRQLPAS